MSHLRGCPDCEDTSYRIPAPEPLAKSTHDPTHALLSCASDLLTEVLTDALTESQHQRVNALIRDIDVVLATEAIQPPRTADQLLPYQTLGRLNALEDAARATRARLDLLEQYPADHERLVIVESAVADLQQRREQDAVDALADEQTIRNICAKLDANSGEHVTTAKEETMADLLVCTTDGAGHLLVCIPGTRPGPGTYVSGADYAALQAEETHVRETYVALVGGVATALGLCTEGNVHDVAERVAKRVAALVAKRDACAGYWRCPNCNNLIPLSYASTCPDCGVSLPHLPSAEPKARDELAHETDLSASRQMIAERDTEIAALRGKLSMVDETLARRPAIEGLQRLAAIEHACAEAGKVELRDAEIARLQDCMAVLTSERDALAAEVARLPLPHVPDPTVF